MREDRTFCTFYISPEDKKSLESLSLEMGYGRGEENKPNVSRLVRAIARKEIVIAQPTKKDQLIRIISECNQLLKKVLSEA